jgi:hypothetical protein
MSRFTAGLSAALPLPAGALPVEVQASDESSVILTATVQ